MLMMMMSTTTTIMMMMSTTTTTTMMMMMIMELQDGKSTVTEKLALSAILFLIVTLSVFGNLLVIFTILSTHRLRVFSNYFLASLAVSDLVVAIVVMVPAAVNDTLGRWLFGQTFCPVWISFDVMFSTASILNLCVISVDRYMLFKDPLKYPRWMSFGKALKFIAVVWVLSALISFLPISMGWHKPAATSAEEVEDLTTTTTTTTTAPQSGTNTTEELNITTEDEICILELSFAYALISSTVSFYVPGVVILVCYIRIYYLTRTLKKDTVGRHNLTQMHAFEAIRTLGIVTAAFFICWIPFFIINPIAAYCQTCVPLELFQTFTWFGYFNSCLNPFIYTFNRDFRQSFIDIFLLKFRKLKRISVVERPTIGHTSSVSSVSPP
nr:hypothetical protein BaRGS_016688 [Batillaria attramentaria]